MGFKLNPFTGKLDAVDSPNGVFEEIEVNGDITLDGRFISSLNGAASAPPGTFTGTWFTGGTGTTTKPQLLIEPTGTASTAWSTSGTGLGVNATSGFTGRLLDLQANGTSRAVVTGEGNVGIGTAAPSSPNPYPSVVDIRGGASDQNYGGAIRLASNNGTTVNSALYTSTTGLRIYNTLATSILFGTNNTERACIDSSGRLLVGTSTDTGGSLFQVNGNRIRIATAKTPASATDTGSAGEICWDADYIYVCTATDTWKRTAISTW